ncbi:MAG: HAMP domain-containing protein [Betaproteobacteria bacterium]|nr:HAMP domain-containing protein [Betaproteobacteria bacterium]
MKLIPTSLLARTALVLALALMASQLVSVVLFQYYSRDPRVQFLAAGFISQLKTVRAALESMPPEQQAAFLQNLRDEKGMRIFRARRDNPLERAPDIPALRVMRERLRDEFGMDADIFVRPRPQAGAGPVLIAKIVIPPSGEFWVAFPRNRIIEADYSWAWIGWGVFGGIVALAGAILLVRRVTRPLRALATAAHELGQGKQPPPVTEVGPEEVKAVAKAFNQMREDLQRLDSERTLFLAGVSHDLRTPLARLRLGLEMLPADPTQRDDLEKDIDDINGIIDQFTDFARDESKETIEVIDLHDLIHQAAERATRMGAKITLDLAEHSKIRARPRAIARLINNLLDNARKHASPDITVRTRRAADGMVLSVLDRGPGIPAAEVARLKQPFTRLDDARSGHSGAGLGMAIIERIAHIHGGRFELLPRDGGGLEARVTLAG